MISKDERVCVYAEKHDSFVLIKGWVSYDGYTTDNFFVDFDRRPNKVETLIWDYMPSNTLLERAYAMTRHMVSILRKDSYTRKDGIYLKNY